MKKTIPIFLMILMILSGCENTQSDKNSELLQIENFNEVEEIIDNDEIAISRLQVAKMIALTFMSAKEINLEEAMYTYEDVNYADSNSKYITAVSNLKIMAGNGINFRPNETLTLEEAEYLLKALNEKNEYSLYISEDNKSSSISYELWVELYYNTLNSLKEESTLYDKYELTEDNYIILEINEGSKTKTNKGEIFNSTIDLAGYLNKEIKVLKKDKEIIAILNILNYKPTINNALITNSTKESINIFSGGAYRKFHIINGLDENLEGKICDITIDKNIATRIVIYTNESIDTVKSYTNKYIELEQLGNVPLSNEYQVYFNDGNIIEHKEFNNLIVGTTAKYVISDDGNIIAVIIDKLYDTNIVRVAINTDDFNSLVHNNVIISSTSGFVVKYKDEILNYEKGEQFELTESDFEKYMNGRFYISPLNDGLLTINSIKRKYKNGYPTYRGNLEIAYIDNGFTIINELTMDEYLYGVIPSEMPVSYGLEALKAQAITARSYAYNQILSNRFYKYGGHVDDSVSSQVYNNMEEQKVANDAVDETSNMFLTYDNNVVSANFYSTSSGNTANSGEVWSNTALGEFPTETPNYLSSRKSYDGDFGDLSVEKNADEFFRNTEVNSFDSNSAWFRWKVNITKNELINSINKNINNRYKINKHMFEVKNIDGTQFLQEEILITDLQNIEIKKRGDGGLITEIEIITPLKTITVKGEYNIRLLLAPKQTIENGRNITLHRKDNTEINNYGLMPSAFFTMDKNFIDDELSGITFFGGGNGHGVGMSQNGAKSMADSGKSYDEILKYYYSDVEVTTF